MRASNLSKAAALAAAVVWAAGCSTTGSTTNAGTADNSGSSSMGASSYGSDSASTSGTDVNDVDALQTVFYFDFDQSVVKPAALSALEGHAQYLAQHPSASIRLEGHTDERGTREYNMALGERRAKSVERVLEVNGVADSQIQTISYGEEKPAALGHNESAWSQNRRVELKYVSK